MTHSRRPAAPRPKAPPPTSIRLTPEAHRQLAELVAAGQFGGSASAVMTLAVDRLYNAWKATPADGADLAAMWKGEK